MKSSIGLLIKKDFFARYPLVNLSCVILMVAFLPAIAKSEMNHSHVFSTFCVLGLIMASSIAFVNVRNTFKVDFTQAGIYSILPVTRKEIIVSRYGGTFIGMISVAALWELFSFAEQRLLQGIPDFHMCSPSMLVISIFAGFMIIDIFLLTSSRIKSTRWVFLMIFIWAFLLISTGNIVTYIIGNTRLNLFTLFLLPTAATMIHILSGVMNYRLIKKDAV